MECGSGEQGQEGGKMVAAEVRRVSEGKRMVFDR